MENYGSNESKDDKSSSTETSTAKPDVAKAHSLAELLIHQDIKQDQQRTIWERESEAAKEAKESKSDKKDSKKPSVAPSLTPESRAKAEPSKETRDSKEATSQNDELSAEDAPLGELEADEARAIAEQYAAGRGAELRDEQAQLPPDSPEQAAAAADAAMMRKLAEKLRAEPEGDPRRAVAEAADEVIAEDNLGNPEQIQAALPIAETEPSDDEQAAARHATSSTPPPPPAAAGGGAQPPGGPPRYPFALGFPGGPGFNLNTPGTPGSPNIYPSPTITRLEAQYYARQAENRGLLVGGIVGYLIGRRRGRIKTEKRLLPVQKKLEKEVTSLHDSIAGRERQIRTLAAQKARAGAALEAAVAPAKLETAVPVARPVETIVPVMAEQAQRFEAVPIPLSSAEGHPDSPRSPESSPEQRIERLQKVELLKAAETVIIEGTSLRQIYEGHHITEKGLRHIMTEHLRGGDVEKALNEELTIKELSYERDPQLRDKLSAGHAIKRGDGTSDSSTIRPRLPFAAEPTTPAAADASDARSKVSPPNNILQGTLIRAWVVLIVVLVIMVTILLFR